MGKRLWTIIIILLLSSSAWAALATENFEVPFNGATRETVLPEGADWVALELESGGKIVVQVRNDELVIEDMKKDKDNKLKDKSKYKHGLGKLNPGGKAK